MAEQTSTQRPPWLVPSYPPLTGEVGEAAVNGQIIYYPQVVRSQRDMPVSQQSHGLVSFMLFKEPRKLKSGKPIYGFFKLRGNWGDPDLAVSQASRIVREQDSKYKIRVADVGAWLPISDDDTLDKKTVDVREEEKDTDTLKEIAFKQNEADRRRIMRELAEREDEVKRAPDYNDDPDGIDYYTMKRVTWIRLTENIELQRKQILNLEEKLKFTRGLLADLDSRHPDFVDTWKDNYNKERRRAGIPDYNPSEKEDIEYNAYVATSETTTGESSSAASAAV